MRVQELADVLTCCNNKKQQTGVELHFQSWDISVIPNPYRFFFLVYSICALWRGQACRAKRKLISSFPADSPNNTERRQKLSFSIISSIRKPLCCQGYSATQPPKLDTRVSDRVSCNVGWTERRWVGGLTPPPGCSVRSFDSVGISRDERKEPIGRDRGRFFYIVHKRYTGNL